MINRNKTFRNPFQNRSVHSWLYFASKELGHTNGNILTLHFYTDFSTEMKFLRKYISSKKLALESLCHRISNFAKTKLLVLFTSGWLSQWWKTWLGFKVKLCKYSATAFRHHLLLFPAPGNPPGPWFAFSTPLSALHWLIANPCLSFHLITLV